MTFSFISVYNSRNRQDCTVNPRSRKYCEPRPGSGTRSARRRRRISRTATLDGTSDPTQSDAGVRGVHNICSFLCRSRKSTFQGVSIRFNSVSVATVSNSIGRRHPDSGPESLENAVTRRFTSTPRFGGAERNDALEGPGQVWGLQARASLSSCCEAVLLSIRH